MRITHHVLAVALLAAAAAGAQQPPPAQPAPPPDPAKLDGYLRDWEKAMQSVQMLSAAIERVENNKSLQYKEVYSGSAHYMKPNLAILDLSKKDNKEVFERYI